MKCLLFSLAFFFASIGHAQDCSNDLLGKKSGSWKSGQQGSINNVIAADLAREKTVINSIYKLISTNYNPTGCQVNYSTVFGKHPSAGQQFIADPYHLALYILRFRCDPNSSDKSKYYVEVATPTTVNIVANAIYHLNSLFAANVPGDDIRGYYKLKERPVKKDDAWFLGQEVVGDRGTPGEVKEYRWLVTYGDDLPFKYVSRKDYLDIQLKRMEQTIKEEGASDYNSQFIKNIQLAMKQPADELNKPAICPWNDEQRFTGFVLEGSQGSFIAVQPNPGYFHKNLPNSSPQYFTVVYKFVAGDPVFAENIANIQKALDFKALKAMLGK